MKQGKRVRIRFGRREPECQWGHIEVTPMVWKPDGKWMGDVELGRWMEAMGPRIMYEFVGVNDFEDTMEVIKGRYEVVQTEWMSQVAG